MIAGQKIEIEVTITKVTERFIKSRDGGTWNTPERTYKMQDGSGNIYTWFSKEAIHIGDEGEQVKIKATVKELTNTEIKLIRCRKA